MVVYCERTTLTYPNIFLRQEQHSLKWALQRWKHGGAPQSRLWSAEEKDGCPPLRTGKSTRDSTTDSRFEPEDADFAQRSTLTLWRNRPEVLNSLFGSSLFGSQRTKLIGTGAEAGTKGILQVINYMAMHYLGVTVVSVTISNGEPVLRKPHRNTASQWHVYQ